MEKLNLNNQIVLSRPAVRRAKVCVIRKKIKKIKILKSCKKEVDKEKKQNKAERLIEEVQIMKKVREDDVIKFAIINKDIKSILAKTPANDHDHVYAALAEHPDVQKQVKKIRELFPEWEITLPKLLETLGTRSMMKKSKAKNKSSMAVTLDNSSKELSTNSNADTALRIQDDDKKYVRKRRKLDKKEQESSDEDIPELVEVKEKEVKVVDSFFVNKKVLQPKLLIESPKPEEDLYSRSFKNQNRQFAKMDNKGLPPKRDFPRKFSSDRYSFSDDLHPKIGKDLPAKEQMKDEKLHPSWAAKRAQVIKPFEGKKITFDDD